MVKGLAIALPQTWVSEELVLTLVESGVHAGQKVKDAWLKKIRRMDGSLASSSCIPVLHRWATCPQGASGWQAMASGDLPVCRFWARLSICK